MAQEKDLKSILKGLKYPDDAQVMKQLVDQTLQVKTRMGPIRRKLVVLSGKGGVGKSMVTANLALAFARQGLKVGVLDVDLNGPCIPRLLGLQGRRFQLTDQGMIPPVGPLGIKVASMDFLLEHEESPVRWKGSMELSPVWLGMVEMGVIRELLGDIVWGELDLLLIDLPPGAAADKPPVIIGFLPELDGAVVVTTPSEVATMVVKKSIVYARDMGIRVLGLVENMSSFHCPECRKEVSLFDGDSQPMADQMDLPILGRIPFDRHLSEASDRGTPLADATDPMARRFAEVATRIQDCLDLHKTLAKHL